MERIVALLPEGKYFQRVFEVISAAARASGATVRLAPAEFSDEGELGRVMAELENAELVVADVSARNPNVMYEAGMAHGIGKRVLFLAQHGEDFPFDRSKQPAIIYAGNLEFLREEIRRFLGGDSFQPAEAGKTVTDAREKFLGLFGEILKQHGHEHRGRVEMENDKTFLLLEQDMDLGLVQDLARKARELGLRIKLM
jgi:hypothetical protein